MCAATADISVERFNYFFPRGVCVGVQQTSGRQNHSRGAVSALHGFFGEKRFLKRMQTPIFSQTFNRGNGFSFDLAEGSQTGPTRCSLNEHGASATLAFAAAILCSR